MITRTFVLSMMLPALIAGSFLFAAWRARRDAADLRATWSAAPALGLAFVAGYAVILGWPPFPPVEATQRLVYSVLVASVVLAFLAWRAAPPALTWTLRALFSFALPWLLLQANIEYRWSGAESFAWVAGLGAATLLHGLALDVAWQRNPGIAAPLGGAIAWAGCGVVLVLSKSALLGQLAGVNAAALGAAGIVGLLRPNLVLATAGSAIVSWLWVGLSLNAGFYAEGSALALVVAALAPLAGLATARRFTHAGTVRRATSIAVVSAVLSGAAILLAARP